MKEYTLFVGGYTRPFFGKEGGEGIYVFGMNPETGALTLRSTNHQAENPTFLQQRGSLLYSVGELDESEISAFRISEDKTQVTLINKLPLGNHTGYGTQLTLWPDNRHISSANYRGGSLSVCTLGENGEMDRICNTLIYEGSGPDKQQDGSHVHFSLISPGGYLLVANLGCDTVTVYKMDAEDKLHRMENMSVRTPAGRGPRHMCFSRDGSRLLISCECSNTVLVSEWSEEAGVGTCFKRSLSFKRLLSALRNWRISSFLMTEDMYTCAFAGQTSCAASLLMAIDFRFRTGSPAVENRQGQWRSQKMINLLWRQMRTWLQSCHETR